MAIDLAPELLDILACPNCHGSLAVDHDRDELVCLAADCGLAYPVRQGIPVLLIDEARRPGPDLPLGSASSAALGQPGRVVGIGSRGGGPVRGLRRSADSTAHRRPAPPTSVRDQRLGRRNRRPARRPRTRRASLSDVRRLLAGRPAGAAQRRRRAAPAGRGRCAAATRDRRGRGAPAADRPARTARVR